MWVYSCVQLIYIQSDPFILKGIQVPITAKAQYHNELYLAPEPLVVKGLSHSSVYLWIHNRTIKSKGTLFEWPVLVVLVGDTTEACKCLQRVLEAGEFVQCWILKTNETLFIYVQSHSFIYFWIKYVIMASLTVKARYFNIGPGPTL